MDSLARAERMRIEATGNAGTEADDDVDLRMRNADVRSLAVGLVDGQRFDRARDGRARSETKPSEVAPVHADEMNAPPFPLRAMSASSNRDGSRIRTVVSMKILVTGATGKVGSRLAKRLGLRGHHVRALVRDPIRARDLDVELAKGDLLDAASLEAAVRGIDVVVHCAAFFRGATPEEAHAVNDVGTRQLASVALAGGVKRFVFTSTGLVYGANGGRLASEDDPCSPTVAYPVSKLAAERALLAIDGLDVCVLRLPFVYGDGDAHIAEAVPMMRPFSPKMRMSIAHHVDVARAVERVLAQESTPHRIYNVVDDEAPDLATLFASVGEPPPDGSDPERARPFDVLLDGRRIREDLGFTPEFPRLRDAVAAGTA